MSISLVQSIFAPTRGQADRNLRSLRSISEYLKTYPIDSLQVHFGGWGREEYLSEIFALIRDIFPGNASEPIGFDRNYGKAHVINETVRRACTLRPR